MNRYIDQLQNKLKRKKAKIAIVGLGYVGLSLLIRLNEIGLKCYGIDIDKKKINLLKKGKPYNSFFKKKSVNKLKENTSFSSTYKDIKNSDIIVICLPTPITKNKDPDMTSINDANRDMRPILQKGQMLILESTTYPGTTNEIFCDSLSKKFKLGKNFFVAYSPERIDPGNELNRLETTTKIVSGYSKNCKRLCKEFYELIVKNVHEVSNLRTAEFTKLYENIYRSVNIGLINEMKIICDRMNLNIYEVIEAAKTKGFGFSSFYPGPGLGGHCIPVDPFLLSWKSKEFDVQAKFIGLSGEINDSMPYFVLNKIMYALNKNNKNIKNSKILILGVAYKKNIDDVRESPALKIINLLFDNFADVHYYDPYIKMIKVDNKKEMQSLKKVSNFKSFDLVCLVTDHDLFDYDKILSQSKIVVDTRGKFKAKLSKVFIS